MYAEVMPLNTQLPLVLLQNYSCMSNSTAAACVQAKMAADELVHANHIKSWQTKVKVEEERARRMASFVRTELADKTQKLKVIFKTPFCDILLPFCGHA